MTGVLACGPRPVAIGFAYGLRDSGTVLTVARAALAESRDPATPKVVSPEPGRIRWSGSPAGAVELADWITKVPGIVGVVGHSDSRGALLAAPIYAEAGLPQVVPNATNVQLRNAGPWTFTLSPDDSVEGAFIGAFIAESLHATSATIFYEDDEYGVDLRNGVRDELTARGIGVVVTLPIGTVCADPAPASLALGVPAAHPPGVVVIAGRTRDASCIVRHLRGRFPHLPFVAGDGVEFDTLFLKAMAQETAFYAVGLWNPASRDSLSQAFVSRFRRTVGRDPLPSDALVYDAVMVLADAARKSGGRRTAIRDYLRNLGHAVPSFTGVTGPITFGGGGQPGLARPMIMLRTPGR